MNCNNVIRLKLIDDDAIYCKLDLRESTSPSQTWSNKKQCVIIDDHHKISDRKSGYDLKKSFNASSKCSEYQHFQSPSIAEKTLLCETPFLTRRRRKDVLESNIKGSDSECDFSNSESDFSATLNIDSASSSDSGDSSNCEKYSATSTPKCGTRRRPSTISVNTSCRRRRLDFNEYDYIFDSDEFFQTRKAQTSSNTLRKFNDFVMKREELNTLLTCKYIRHEVDIERLLDSYALDFHKWMFYLKDGFNLLLYGLGSKVKLLDRFVRETLNDCYVLKVKGFSPKFSIRELMNTMFMNIFNERYCPSNVDDAIDQMAELLKKINSPVFLIVHNLDSSVLRLPKNQIFLSRLAALSGLHFIATVDHVNAPLLWGKRLLRKYNFWCVHVSTYQPYIQETLADDASTVQTTLDRGLSSLSIVYNGCVEKTKKLFKIILEDRLYASDHKYKGIHLNKLLSRASSELFINDKKSLSNMLNNFFEHDILKLVDDCIFINISRNLLITFHEEHKDL